MTLQTQVIQYLLMICFHLAIDPDNSPTVIPDSHIELNLIWVFFGSQTEEVPSLCHFSVNNGCALVFLYNVYLFLELIKEVSRIK